MSATSKPRPSSRWRWLIALTLVTALWLEMPATWLAHLLNQQCAGQCRLAQASGHWWNGQGELFVKAPANGGWIFLGEFAWRLSLPSRLELDLGHGHAVLDAGWRELQVSLDQLALPAEAVLAQRALGLPAAGWEGILHFRKTSFAWDYRQAMSATGVLAWENAATSMMDKLPLGNFDLHWSWNKAQGLSGQVANTAGGPLMLRGDLLLGPGIKPVLFNGLVELSPAARPQLERYIRLIAQPLGNVNGRYEVSYQSR